MDKLELGSVPNSEDCVQVSKDGNYHDAMRAECKRYKQMLIDKFPIPDDVNAYFVITSNPHDFGTYYEVAIKFDDNDDKSCDFAYFVEENCPDTWDDTNVMIYGSVPEKKFKTLQDYLTESQN